MEVLPTGYGESGDALTARSGDPLTARSDVHVSRVRALRYQEENMEAAEQIRNTSEVLRARREEERQHWMKMGQDQRAKSLENAEAIRWVQEEIRLTNLEGAEEAKRCEMRHSFAVVPGLMSRDR